MKELQIMGGSFWAILAVVALVAGCGDDDGMVTPTDAGPRDTGMTEDSGGIDSGPADAGPDAGPPGECDRYCDAIIANCTGDNAQYDDRADCIAYCGSAGWPVGTAGEMDGNTIECRIYHAEFAASSMDPVTHCPHAGPTGADVCGSVTFRTDAPSAYTRVDRMGMPAVSTALVSSASKNAYNDADPADDAAGTFAADLIANLTGLHTALDDDLIDLSLTPCSMTELIGTLPECLGQNYAPGKTVASLVLPDTLHVDPSADPGFPNGRTLPDPVIDVTLAVILLELGSGTCGTAMCGAGTLAGVPLNPAMNDEAFLTTFPYLAPPHE